MSYLEGGFSLETNGTLKNLIRLYKDTPQDWSALNSAYFQSADETGVMPVSKDNLPAALATFQLNRLIKDASQTTPDLIHQPIPNGFTTEHFQFRREDLGKNIIHDMSGPYTAVDSISMCDDLLAVWAIKTGASTPRHVQDFSMNQPFVRKLATPIAEYIRETSNTHFRTNRFAYILVLSEDLLKKHTQDLIVFKNNGGIVVPFGASATAHRERIIALQSRER